MSGPLGIAREHFHQRVSPGLAGFVERINDDEMALAAFAAQQPAIAGKGIRLLVSEGLRERGLAHAADAVDASRGLLRRIQQRGAQAGQFQFAPDEVCVRPGEIGEEVAEKDA